MAELGVRESQLTDWESAVFKNLLMFPEIKLKDAMTPRPVVFSLPEKTTVSEFMNSHQYTKFSRIPVYRTNPDYLEGFVLRSDILLARAQGHLQDKLKNFRRSMPVLPNALTLAQAFKEIYSQGAHMAQVVDEYGNLVGILTLEDIIETLLGLEIVDEGDAAVDMQELAHKLWQERSQRYRLFMDDEQDTR